MENSKELFVKAFMEAESLDNFQLKKEEEIDWNFSKKFENSMNKLIKKNNRIRISTRLKIRKGLIAAIIAIIVLFTGLINVSATRTPFIEFIKKVFPKFNQITLSDESTPPIEKIETEYTLTDLPDGYEIDIYQKDKLVVMTKWKNKSGDEIVLFQETLDPNLSIDTEHNYQELKINRYEAYLMTTERNSVLSWTDGYYWFTLNAPNNLNDDLINMAENISEKN
ncbi:MAG: DUF4367 domain-containing protein [Clostridiales bacterium]|nr:DUF4367 domain-containing protein [Clostridiales bacterium]